MIHPQQQQTHLWSLERLVHLQLLLELVLPGSNLLHGLEDAWSAGPRHLQTAGAQCVHVPCQLQPLPAHMPPT